MINRPNARIDDWVWLGLAHVQLWDPSILATRCIIQPHQVHNPHFCGKSLPKRESPIHLWCKFWWNLQNLNESDGFPWVPNFETAQRQYVWCGFQPSSGIGSGHHKSKFLGVNRYYEYVQRPRKINMYFQDGIDGIDAFRLCCMYLYMSMYIYIR